MPDREKVIDNLEYHIHLLYDVIPHVSRDDGEYLEAAAKTMSDAFILLKAQEPVEATVCNNDISGAGIWWYQCGKCKMPIDPKDRFCRHCGQAVKWQ